MEIEINNLLLWPCSVIQILIFEKAHSFQFFLNSVIWKVITNTHFSYIGLCGNNYIINIFVCSTTIGCSSSSLIEMDGQGKLLILTDDEVVNINALLEKHDLQPLKSNQGQIYTKATIKGKVYFSKENRRITKTNRYTISFSNPPSIISFGIVINFYTYWWL